MSTITPNTTDADLSKALGRLGSGEDTDQLSFRMVIEVMWRCTPLLREVRWHIAGFLAIVVLLSLVGLGAGAMFLDLFWTRILEGHPLTELQASLLGLDHAVAVDVEVLSEELRKSIRDRLVIDGLIVAAVIGPLIGGLFYYSIWILQRINQSLRAQLIARVQTLSLRFHADNRIGDSVYRLYQDSAMVTDLIRVLFVEPAWFVGQFIVAVVLVAVFDPQLAWILVATWPPTLLIGALYSKRLRVNFRRARESNSALTSQIVETLAGVRVVKAFGAEPREQQRFERASQHAFGQAFRARAFYALFGVVAFWIAGAALLATSGWGALLTREGDELFAVRFAAVLGFSAWNLGLFNFFKSRAGSATVAIESIFRLWARTQDIAIGLDRVFELLDVQPEVEDAPDAVPMAPFREAIVFKGVRFAYDPTRPVLHDVDWVARAGSITAIVGPTGSGKSTLMVLLLRLFDPDAGAIEIDGVDIRRLKLRSLRDNIAIALQENLLFGDTIRENIRYAVPAASDEQVREVARVACADEFIDALPNGYDTMLGERGMRLSTGQRQRLSIARALLKDAPILILDEPTASLDAETELRLMRNLETWGRGRVVFLIAHRLSTVRHADAIAVMQAGRIVESGAHEDLVAVTGGVYQRLLDRTDVEAGAA